MSEGFLAFYNSVDQVTVDDDNVIIHEHGKRLMEFPKKAFSLLVMNYDRILRDLEETNKDGRKYWDSFDTSMYTKSAFEKNGCHIRALKVFAIVKAPYEMFLQKEDFQSMLIHIAILYRIRADAKARTERGLEYKLDEQRQVVFTNNGMFSIYDKSTENEIKIEMSLDILASMVVHRNEVLGDLGDNISHAPKVYWKIECIQIETVFAESRQLCISDKSENKREPTKIHINDGTFKCLVNIALGRTFEAGDRDAEMHGIRQIHWNSIPIHFVGSFKFPVGGLEITLISKDRTKYFDLCITALQEAKRAQSKILADLIKEDFQLTHEKDYIEEYWADGDYALRTGPFYDLYRNRVCNVVRVTRIIDNYDEFLMNEETFNWFINQVVPSSEKVPKKERPPKK